MFNFIKKPKYIIAIVSIILFLILTILIFAHINNVKTFISPALDTIGVHSKIENNTLKIKLLDTSIENSDTLIVGYKISPGNIDISNWIKVNGAYEINGISVTPISDSISKDSKTYFLYYQVFDISKIELDNLEKITFTSNISEILEYSKLPNINNTEDIPLNKYSCTWNFEENILINNLTKNKTYHINSRELTSDQIFITANTLVQTSRAHMIEIKTDLSTYTGSSFVALYVVYDEDKNKIAFVNTELKHSDSEFYIDRLFLDNIDFDSELTIDIYIKYEDTKNFEKHEYLYLNLSNSYELYEEYSCEDYSFDYKYNWNLHGIINTTEINPYSDNLTCLHLEAPASTNAYTGFNVYISKQNKTGDIETYINDLIVKYINQSGELFSKEITEISKLKAYKIINEVDDYFYVDHIIEFDDVFYCITIHGLRQEYLNHGNEVNNLLSTFKLNNVETQDF